MKKFILLAIVSIAFTFKGSAQEYQNVVKINPLGALFGSANVAYERALNEGSSVVIAPSFGLLKSAGFKYTSFGIGAEYRFYFSKEKSAPMGFYAGPGAGFNFGEAKWDDSNNDNSNKTSFSGFNVKGIIGYQWIWSSGFTLDLNGGIQYLDFKFKDSDVTGTPISGVLPTIGFSLGYSF